MLSPGIWPMNLLPLRVGSSSLCRLFRDIYRSALLPPEPHLSRKLAFHVHLRSTIMLTTVISPRKIFLPGVFFLAILLIFYQSLPSSYKLPANHPASGAAEKGEAEPVITDPNEGKFQWAQVTQRYPVESLIPLPTDTAAIPRIQHDFPPESEEARKARISRLEEIKAEFQHAWKGYKEHAWLRDEVGPISGDARDTFGGWAATLIDSLGRNSRPLLYYTTHVD
ncbi:Glycoside hydrolase family 47 [Macrophomina phaseolina MS6]|uniref:Glycoside hydrolase family 47 n=1 Tax=Macrophomina phaseolina (strain MS6) TaxID=1126212 RepID=K2SDG2_MACPH|nr:Glycoside hydrolase family 47 [Macrophomina phaseolina MS6]